MMSVCVREGREGAEKRERKYSRPRNGIPREQDRDTIVSTRSIVHQPLRLPLQTPAWRHARKQLVVLLLPGLQAVFAFHERGNLSHLPSSRFLPLSSFNFPSLFPPPLPLFLDTPIMHLEITFQYFLTSNHYISSNTLFNKHAFADLWIYDLFSLNIPGTFQLSRHICRRNL